MEGLGASGDRDLVVAVDLTGAQFPLATDRSLCVSWREADCGVSNTMSEEGMVRFMLSIVWLRLDRNVRGQQRTDTLRQTWTSRETVRLEGNEEVWA